MLHQPLVLHRFFFALLPPPVLARRIAHAAAPWFADGGTPVRDDRLHVTMFILPDFSATPRGLEAALCEVGARVAAAPVAVALDRVSGGSRSIALRPSRRIAGLQALHAEIDATGQSVGVPSRPRYSFNAHMTLGYREGPPFSAILPPFAWTASELVLIHSHVGLTRHDVVGRWPLDGKGDPQLGLW